MNILLTMVGAGSRFKNAGFTQEKYEIEFAGHTLFEWSLASLASFRSSNLVIVTQRFPIVDAFVTETATKLGFARPTVVFSDRLTRGQAESACLARTVIDPDESVLIYNTDTHVAPGALSPASLRGDGWIPCFEAPGDHWSFVEADDDGLATRVVEKNRISANCSIGLYYFRRFGDLIECTDAALASDAPGEIYVAPRYQELIEIGRQIYIDVIDADAVVPLGTPAELGAAPLDLAFPI